MEDDFLFDGLCGSGVGRELVFLSGNTADFAIERVV
jgi:hypothetical protein